MLVSWWNSQNRSSNLCQKKKKLFFSALGFASKKNSHLLKTSQENNWKKFPKFTVYIYLYNFLMFSADGIAVKNNEELEIQKPVDTECCLFLRFFILL